MCRPRVHNWGKRQLRISLLQIRVHGLAMKRQEASAFCHWPVDVQDQHFCLWKNLLMVLRSIASDLLCFRVRPAGTGPMKYNAPMTPHSLWNVVYRFEGFRTACVKSHSIE